MKIWSLSCEEFPLAPRGFKLFHFASAFVQDSAGESLYMLFRAIKHQVDKGPVDAVTGKAKYTLNDNRLLREDVEYKTLVRRPPHSPFHPHPGFSFLCDTD